MRYLYYLLFSLSLVFAQQPNTWWVDAANGSDSNDGKTEANAFKSIQNVFDSYLLGNYADTIRVKPGTYDFSRGYISNANKPFVMVSTGGATQTILDANNNNRFIILAFNNEDAVTVFDGFTFKNGLLPSNQGSQGGAVAIYGNTKADFRNCVFENNKADYSGGAVFVGGQATVNFESCLFTENEAGEQGGAIHYDPVYNDQNLRNQYLSIKKSKFFDNRVKSDGGGQGGAIFSSRQLEIVSSVFANNYSLDEGEDQYYGGSKGGAITFDIYSWDEQQQTSVGGNARIINSTFDGNYVTGPGVGMGGTISYGGVSTKLLIFNSIISNSAVFQNGTIYQPSGNYNGPGLVIGTYNGVYNKVYADYSNIQDAVNEDWAGNNVYDTAPGFVDRLNKNYRLSDKSPLIGVGIDSWNDWGLKAPDYDINGNFRPTPQASDPDLGAYENANGAMTGPMPPGNFSAKAISYGAKLAWSPSIKSLNDPTLQDNIEYRVYQDGKRLTTLKDTLYTATSLTLGTSYSFSVSAIKTDDSSESIILGPIAVTPTYLGPWYVATSGGKSTNEQNNAEFGSRDYPINHLTSALEIAAAGDTIIMMEGTHSGVTNRNISIQKQIVITGDPTKGPDKTIIDAENKGRHFLFNANNTYDDNLPQADSSWVIQNITLYRGKASGDNWQAAGGSIRLGGTSSPRFYNVIFRENVDETTNGWTGAAIFVDAEATLNADLCQFIDNKTTNLNGDPSGGAIGLVSYGKHPHRINASIFKGNEVKGKWSASGSAIATNSAVFITNSLFYNNLVSTEQGSARGTIWVDGPYSYYNKYSLFINNTIANNDASSGSGGTNVSGIYFRDYDYYSGSGMNEKHTAYAFNNIIYGNTVSQNVSPAQIDNFDLKSAYQILQNLDQALLFNPELSFDYTYDVDPGFTDPANGDFSLSGTSLALGKGVASWDTYIDLTAPLYDIVGNERPAPSGSSPDLGAYENGLAKSPAPPPVEGLVAKGGSGQIELTWNQSPDKADDPNIYYKVYMDTKPITRNDSTFVKQTQDTTHTQTGLNNASRYYFQVTAINSGNYESPPASIDLSPSHKGPVWWVATNGSDSGDGSSGRPFSTLLKAMEEATSGDTVMLKPGTYNFNEMSYPIQSFDNATGNYSQITFENLVIRSEKGAASTIIDASRQGRHFMIGASDQEPVDSTFKFVGLTFRGGMSSDKGGSFVIETYSQSPSGFISGDVIARPKFEDCRFVDNGVGGNNSFGEGGAIFANNASPIFENCRFDSNYANVGGAIYYSGNPNSSIDMSYIRNSSFNGNTAYNDGGGEAYGGAIAVYSGQQFLFTNTTFNGNVATNNFGSSRGGALYISNQWDPQQEAAVIIVNSRFTKNVVESQPGYPAEGGAISASSPFAMAGSVVDSNFSSQAGGAIAIDMLSVNQFGSNYKGFADLINNTIINNIADSRDPSFPGFGGGIADYNIDQHEKVWFNNIIWGNQSNNQNEPSHGVWMSTNNGQPVSNQGTDWNGHNNIQNVAEIKDYYGYDFGENTLSVDPNFKSAGSYQLSDSSPMIGAGSATFYEDGETTLLSVDIDGNRRPSPSGSNPDIGAYENSLAKSPYPDQVRDLVAEELTQSVQLMWTPNNASNIMHYNVYYSSSKTTERNELTKATSTADTMHLVTNLQNGVEYHFVVSAVDSSNFEGPFSEMVSAIPTFDGPNWWVNAAASMDGDGSFNAPFKFIGDAINRVNERGDTIRLQAGTYEESLLFFSATDQLGGQPGDDPHQHLIKEIAIIGSGTENTIVDANNTGSHFIFNEVEKALIMGITFTNGYTDSYGGSLQAFNVDSLALRNVNFSNNNSGQGGGAVALNGGSSYFNNVVFSQNRVSFGGSDNMMGQGGAIILFNGGQDFEYSDATFENCVFLENGIETNSNSAAAHGSVIHVNDGAGVAFVQSTFERNFINNSGGSSSFANALININAGNSVSSWDEYPTSIIEQSLFKENYIQTDGDALSSLLYSNVPLEFINNLVINNAVGGDGSNTMISLSANEDQGGTKATSHIVNNTFHGNNGNGLFIDVTGNNEYVWMTNNIIWANNKGQNESSDFYQAFGTTVYAQTNIFESDVTGTFTSVDNINEDPKLRNPASGDYRLQGNSPAIDAGVDVGEVFDYRGFYRVGLPDIGAFESGASKYILAIQDDIVGDKDTTFVTREDTLEFTITTNDIDGNLVNSNESVQWSIFPSAKYVTLITSDPNTSGGSATATFKVSEQAKGKGFRFRIEAEIGESIMRSEMYVIEELVTGAPPPVPVLTISPSGWSTKPDFTIAWTIPSWTEERDLLGAIVEVNDGINFYDEFIGFPENNPLKAYAFSVPEPGAFDASIRLMDEYGNEDPDSAKTIQALYDDIVPESFYINWPNSYADQGGNMEVSWVSDKPRFEWQNFGDYPSGIEKWVLYVNGEEFGTYTENSIDFVEQDAAIEDTSKSLEDGMYEWYIKTIDFAENSTNSDTGYFGVDLNPPLIVHNSPLTTVDEGSTTPSINVEVSDGGSGVKDVYLNYRRSGSNSGFVTVPLWDDGQITPSSIPGSDIRSEGVEYFIDAIDELGNYSEWPYDYNGKYVQSVVARTQNNVTTADYWSAGIPTGTDTSAYQLFSIPFNTNKGLSAITEVLGPPDEFKYRLYGWNNGWNEFTEMNPLNIRLGDAYFFIWDKEQYPDVLQLNFDFGTGESTPTAPPFEIPAAAGEWKFFGNPYNFPVNLINVRTQADVPITDEGSIYTWSSFGGWINPGSNLEPWKGYIYKSASDPDIYVDGTGDVFGKRLAKTTTPDINNISMDANEWVINILASTGRSRDESNSVGVLNIASDGYDRLDEFEPPAVPGNISLSINNRDRVEVPDVYSIDIRKPNEQGHYWDLEVITPTNGKRTYLTFEGLGYVPDEYDIFIINKTNKQAQNLKWESGYRFANTGPDSYLKQDLRLVIGSKKFVEKNNAGVSLYPDAFVLSQNYPNPFNPQTSIMISLQEEAQVDLVIYNLLGEEITRLSSNEIRPAGYYNFIWNGMNTSGNKVSTGVYLYHAMVKDRSGKMVLNKTKKMVFLK